jgi:hypothetical protein
LRPLTKYQPFPKTNAELVRGVEKYAAEVHKLLGGKEGDLFVETAGGKWKAFQLQTYSSD